MEAERPRLIGRYALYDQLGQGAMGSVSVGVARDASEPVLVAAKELLPSLERDPRRVAMFVDEMRITRLAQHPNVVTVRDLVYDGDRMVLVMDYVHGESLRRLFGASLRQRPGTGIPMRLAAAIVHELLLALDAAHNARDEKNAKLGIVHRDVTPENVLVDASGVVRLADFGVAKAEGRLASTRGDGVKGKLPYLAPEQVGGTVSHRTDIYAAGLVLWELLVGRRALQGDNEAHLLMQVLTPTIPAPSAANGAVSPLLDGVVSRAIAPAAANRFESAAAFADALSTTLGPDGMASRAEIAAWVAGLVGERLAARQRRLDAILAMERGPVSSGGFAMATSAEPVPTLVDPPRASRARYALGAAAAGIVLVLAGATTFAVRTRTSPQAAAPLSTQALAAAPPPAPPLASVTASATPAPAELPETKPAPKKKSAPAAPSHARAGCDPPFVVDAKGILVYKNECLK